MSADALGSRPLQLDDQLAQELSVPLVFVRLEQLVRLLVSEEIEDQGPQRRGRTNLLVKNARVAGRGNGVRRFAEPCDTAQDVIAQWGCQQAIAKAVQVDEQEVFGATSVVPQVAIRGRLGLNKLGPGRRRVEYLVMLMRREMWDLVCRARDRERSCV